MLLLSVIALWVGMVLNPSNLWVQSDYAIHLPRSTRDGLAVDPVWDLLNTVATQAGLDRRARFLGYFLIALDQKIRLALYEFCPVPPSFNPILWILHGVVGPMLLFRFVALMTGSVATACIAVAIYASSPGFLYVFTMNWVPQKALVSLAFISLLWLGARIDVKSRPGALFFEGLRLDVVAVLVVTLAAFFSDEYGFLAPALLAIMFWWRFVPDHRPSARAVVPAVKNCSLLLLPLGVFALVMSVIVPFVSRRLFDTRFNYWATVKIGRSRAAAVAGGAWLIEAMSAPLLNLINMLSISLLPYSITGLSAAFPPHFGVQALGLAHLAAIPVFAFVVGLTARQGAADGSLRHRLLPAIAATLVFVGAISMLALAHVPRLINGFYYGSPVALTFAVLVAYMVRYSAGLLRVFIVGLAFWIAVVQFQNFIHLNGIWSRGSEAAIPSLYGDALPMRPPGQGWSYRDLHKVLAAARAGELDAYLDQKQLPPRLFYVIAEQCTIAPNVSHRCAVLMAMLKRLKGTP